MNRKINEMPLYILFFDIFLYNFVHFVIKFGKKKIYHLYEIKIMIKKEILSCFIWILLLEVSAAISQKQR